MTESNPTGGPRRAAARDELVVGTRRGKLASLLIPLLVVGCSLGLCQIALLAFMVSNRSAPDDSGGWVSLLISAALATLVAVLNVVLWGYVGFTFVNRLRTDEVLVVDRAGVRLFHRPKRSVFLPWEVLGPPGGGTARFRFRLRPGVDVDHPGITGLDGWLLRWSLRHFGLQVGMFGLTTDRNTIAAAIRHFSAGRVWVT